MRTLTVVMLAVAAALPHVACGADYYLANTPGSRAGTEEDPFGLADLPKPDNRSLSQNPGERSAWPGSGAARPRSGAAGGDLRPTTSHPNRRSGISSKPTRALTVLQPGDTLYFKGGQYALHTGPVKVSYYVALILNVKRYDPAARGHN